ncbi:MAG: hypothetical protein AAF371_01995 [Pseudomonadota bacterium]
MDLTKTMAAVAMLALASPAGAVDLRINVAGNIDLGSSTADPTAPFAPIVAEATLVIEDAGTPPSGASSTSETYLGVGSGSVTLFGGGATDVVTIGISNLQATVLDDTIAFGAAIDGIILTGDLDSAFGEQTSFGLGVVFANTSAIGDLFLGSAIAALLAADPADIVASSTPPNFFGIEELASVTGPGDPPPPPAQSIFTYETFEAAVVPVPATLPLALGAIGVLGLMGCRRRA